MLFSAIKYIFWRFRIFYIIFLFLRTLLSFYLTRRLRIWLILEINFLCFVRLLRQELRIKNTNGNIYYFLIQSLGRALMLIRILNFLIFKITIFEFFFYIFILLKLGGAPFQFWYLKLIQKLSWINIWLLSIWQKLIPLLLLKLRNNFLILLFGLLRVFIGRITNLNQKKIKKILGLSSLFSLGWVLISLIFSKIWIWFMVGYGIALFFLLSFIKYLNFIRIESLESLRFNYIFIIIFYRGLLIIRGIPPFIIFYLKIIILIELIKLRIVLVLVLLIIRIFIIYIYLIIGFSLLTFLKSISSTRKMNYKNIISLINYVLYNLLYRIIIIIFI